MLALLKQVKNAVHDVYYVTVCFFIFTELFPPKTSIFIHFFQHFIYHYQNCNSVGTKTVWHWHLVDEPSNYLVKWYKKKIC